MLQWKPERNNNMNNQRRKWIRSLINELQSSSPDFESISCNLEDLLCEETESMDNTPESLQDTERYLIMEESCYYLEDALSILDPDVPNTAEWVAEILAQIDGIWDVPFYTHLLSQL